MFLQEKMSDDAQEAKSKYRKKPGAQPLKVPKSKSGRKHREHLIMQAIAAADLELHRREIAGASASLKP
jgi:hypothetical protein